MWGRRRDGPGCFSVCTCVCARNVQIPTLLCVSHSDGQFPIDISSVTRDHDFLDGDAIEALCR